MTKDTIIRRRQLEKLKREIEKKFRKGKEDSGLFPERNRMQGFLGVGKFMIIGERPSSATKSGENRIPSDRTLNNFYEVLLRLGIEDSHLTDVIKGRARARDPYPNDLGPHYRIFKQEIEIVQPRRIIVVGEKAYNLLRFGFAGQKFDIKKVPHYAHRFSKRPKFEEMKEAIKL